MTTTTTTTTATAHVNALLTARVARTYADTTTRCERCGCEPRNGDLFHSEPQDAAVCSRCWTLANRSFRRTSLTGNQFAVLRAIGLGARTIGAIAKVSGVRSARDSVERLFDIGLVYFGKTGFCLQTREVAAAARRRSA